MPRYLFLLPRFVLTRQPGEGRGGGKRECPCYHTLSRLIFVAVDPPPTCERLEPKNREKTPSNDVTLDSRRRNISVNVERAPRSIISFSARPSTMSFRLRSFFRPQQVVKKSQKFRPGGREAVDRIDQRPMHDMHDRNKDKHSTPGKKRGDFCEVSPVLTCWALTWGRASRTSHRSYPSTSANPSSSG